MAKVPLVTWLESHPWSSRIRNEYYQPTTTSSLERASVSQQDRNNLAGKTSSQVREVDQQLLVSRSRAPRTTASSISRIGAGKVTDSWLLCLLHSSRSHWTTQLADLLASALSCKADHTVAQQVTITLTSRSTPLKTDGILSSLNYAITSLRLKFA